MRRGTPLLLLLSLLADRSAFAAPAPDDGGGGTEAARAASGQATDGAGQQPTSPGGDALSVLAGSLARQTAGLLPGPAPRLHLEVEAASPRLASAAELALAQALREAALAPTPRDEAADASLHLLLELRDGELIAAGEVRQVRPNFFTGSVLAAGGPLSARLPADEAMLLLAGAADAPAPALELFATLDEAPLALAVGSLGGTPQVAALTRDAIVLFDLTGSERLRHPLPPEREGARASRDPRAGLVIVGDRLRYALPLLGQGAVLRLADDALEYEAEAPADVLPLAAGPEGLLSAQLLPDSNLFTSPLLLARGDRPVAPVAATLPAPFVTVLAAPDGGPLPWGVVDEGGGFLQLQADLQPGAARRTGVGDAAALADLDGDGRAELVASDRVHRAPDRVRVLPPGDAGEGWTSEEIGALLLTAASGRGEGGAELVIFGADDGRLFLLRGGRR